MRVRNTHPSRPLMCSGLHLQPGAWHTVGDAFRAAHGDVPDLEFETDELAPGEISHASFDAPITPGVAASLASERDGPSQASTAPYLGDVADDLGYAHGAAALDAEADAGDDPVPAVTTTKTQYEIPASEELAGDIVPYARGESAGLEGADEDSCPFPDGRTKDAKEWRRGWQAGVRAAQQLRGEPPSA